MNFFVASSSANVWAYTLQSKVGGASGLRVMTWSSCRVGGNRCEASLEKTCAWCRYSSGICRGTSVNNDGGGETVVLLFSAGALRRW